MGFTIWGFVISLYGVISISRPAWNGIKWFSKTYTRTWDSRPATTWKGIPAKWAAHGGKRGFGGYSLVQQSLPPLWGGGRKWPPASGFGRTSRRLLQGKPPRALVLSAHRATELPAWNQKPRAFNDNEPCDLTSPLQSFHCNEPLENQLITCKSWHFVKGKIIISVKNSAWIVIFLQFRGSQLAELHCQSWRKWNEGNLADYREVTYNVQYEWCMT